LVSPVYQINKIVKIETDAFSGYTIGKINLCIRAILKKKAGLKNTAFEKKLSTSFSTIIDKRLFKKLLVLETCTHAR